jgi:hypothetical protein
MNRCEVSMKPPRVRRWICLGLAVAGLLTVAVWLSVRRVPPEVAAWRQEFQENYVGRELSFALANGLLDDAFRHQHAVAFEWHLPGKKVEPDDPVIASMGFREVTGQRVAVVRIFWAASRFRS